MSMPLECGCQPVLQDNILTVVPCEAHDTRVRDPRWENVYAYSAPYDHDNDITFGEVEPGRRCGYTIFRINVEYKGKPYWAWQLFDEDDLKDIDHPDIKKWIWHEMIARVDEEMKGVE